MADRLYQMMSPVAMLNARKMAPAFEALCAQACMDSAMTGALVARGLQPGQAQILVDQWKALGLTISPSVYAPAHVAEAALTGRAETAAQQVMTAHPSVLGYIPMAPGYEHLAAQPGLIGKAGMPGLSPQVGAFAQPGTAPQMGIFGQPGMAPLVWSGNPSHMGNPSHSSQ